jgi:hypothetical protein
MTKFYVAYTKIECKEGLNDPLRIQKFVDLGETKEQVEKRMKITINKYKKERKDFLICKSHPIFTAEKEW